MPKGVAKSGKRKSTLRAERIVRVCEICGEERFYAPGEIRQREERGGVKIRFCSKACEAKSRVKPERYAELPCPICARSFRKRRDHLRPINYCSHSCASEARRKEDARWRDPERIKVYMSEYQRVNRGRLTEQSRLWVEQNKSLRLEIQRKYRETHRDAIKVHSHKRRAKKVKGSFTAQDWQDMKAFYDYTCLCCHKQEPEIKLTLDHIQPLSRDGIHAAENAQPLCKSCNSRKGTKTIDYREYDVKKKLVEALYGITITEV